MARIFVGVGSNIDPETNIRGGMQALREIFGELTISSVYESPAFGFDGDNFLNLVVSFGSRLEIAEVAGLLREVEVRFGRTPGIPKYSSRTLDLDLLLYDDLIVEIGELKIPRPDITRLGFVLCPLAEIAGDLRHPETGERYEDLWNSFTGEGRDLMRTELRPMGNCST